MKRLRYQYGTVDFEERKKGPGVWIYRFSEDGKRRKIQLGTEHDFPKRALAERAAEAYRMKANPDNPNRDGVKFGALLDRYENEELPARHSTSSRYKSNIKNHIRPKWGDYLLEDIRPHALELWLKEMKLAPKTKGNIKTIVSSVFACAMRWEMLSVGVNPVSLARIKGVSKRKKKRASLTIELVHASIAAIKPVPRGIVDVEMIRTMVYLAVCLGLSCSEMAGLIWNDFDFVGATIWIQRGVVQGRIDDTKTANREAPLPLVKEVLEIILRWRARSRFSGDEDWVFANPAVDGTKPINPWNLQTRYLAPAGREIGLEGLGWHSYRHTYRSLLDATGAPVGVQQKLMRHGSVSMTMDGYGDAYMEQKREVNSAVVKGIFASRSIN